MTSPFTHNFLSTKAARRRAFVVWALLFMCLAFAAGAFAQTAQWVKQMGTGGISNGVSSDAAGNAYATGTISNPGLFDNITIPCNAADVFLSKYDTGGNILWATVGGGPLRLKPRDFHRTAPRGASCGVNTVALSA